LFCQQVRRDRLWKFLPEPRQIKPISCKTLKMIALKIIVINVIIFMDILVIFDLLWFHDFRGLRRSPSTFPVAFPTLLTIPMGGNYA
jgi:hypothetical protein